MPRKPGTFYVETFDNGIWVRKPFVESQSLKYCHGYVDAYREHHYGLRMRIVKASGATQIVLRDTNKQGD
jgi:hypothetical protein